ncbi:hypothetical protein [Halorientalis halophila]|uniref:hypothetical protein n=1 Tax=Halorientalis halophila TaxID=3108499 RepID=UPI003009C7A2
MQRRTLKVVATVALVLLAGCTGSSPKTETGPTADGQSPQTEGTAADDEDQSPIVTYRNETESGTLSIRANTTAQTYSLSYNVTQAVDPATDSASKVRFATNYSLGFMCEFLNEIAYNNSRQPDRDEGDPSGPAVTKADWEFEGTELPPNLFETYAAQSVTVRVYDTNTELLGRCSIPEKNEIQHEILIE